MGPKTREKKNKTVQEAPKRRQEVLQGGPRGAQESPRSRPGRTREPPNARMDPGAAPGPHFGQFLVNFLIIFWWIFG